MDPLKSKIPKALPVGAKIPAADNSGAKVVEIVSVKGQTSVRSQNTAAGVGDLVLVTVKKGKPDVRRQVFPAVIVRQKKPIRRPDGSRMKFEDNAAVLLKDEKGNPKGTIFKGPVAREACERWPGVAKVAKIIV